MKRIKDKIKAIIFDMDGTIIKSDDQWKVAMKKTVVQENICAKKAEAHIEKIRHKFSAAGIKVASKILKEEFKISSCETIIEKNIESFAKKEFLKKIEFIEGFKQFHKEVKKHQIPSSIATNADPASFKIIIKNLKLDSMFGEHLYSASDVEYKFKPDPAVFLHAAKKLKVKPSQCLVFEDSLHGFKAAKAAGMKCIAIENETNKELKEFVQAHIENYHQAIEKIVKIFS